MPGLGKSIVVLFVSGIALGVSIAFAVPAMWRMAKPFIRAMVA